jgi:hypothetical protein
MAFHPNAEDPKRKTATAIDHIGDPWDKKTNVRHSTEERPPITIRITFLRPPKQKSLIDPQASLPSIPPI